MDLPLEETGEGPYTSECTRSNRSTKRVTLLLNGREENFASVQPQLSEISWLSKRPKTPLEAKNYKQEVDTCLKCEWQR